MRVFLLIILSALVLAGCGEDKPKSMTDAAMKSAKDTVNTVSEGAKSTVNTVSEGAESAVTGAKDAVNSLPAGVRQAMPTFENFSQMCAQCHDANDVKRYETTFLPMYQMMFDPKAWINPNAYGRVMQPMMDPETYTKWYEAWTKSMMPGPMPGTEQQQK